MADTYYSADITFCVSPCTKTSCYRHKSNIRDQQRDHAVAELKGTVYCPARPEPERPRRKRRKAGR